MKQPIALVALAGMMFVSTHTFADDSTGNPTTAQQRQMMKECMKMQMDANPGMSKADMKTSCKEKMTPKDPTADVASGGPTKPQSH